MNGHDNTSETPGTEGKPLKQTVARALKWNVIDRFSSQILYVVTGVVLARELSQEEFGIIGAIQVFQAFALLFIDSGFAAALLQRKSPTRLDYSSVLWFNLGVAVILYIILFFSAPLIADIFQGDRRLIPLSRVMLVTFIINALTIVQVNRLVKRMDTRMVAVSNSAGLIAGAVVGIFLAVTGYGAWALVWQAIAVSTFKAGVLWLTSGWTPVFSFSWLSIRSFIKLGSGVMFTSILNTIFLTIGSFFIGHKVSLASLGYYTQADKWSKMGVTSLTQVFTSTFVPMLSGVQDDPERFANMAGKTHRFVSYLVFPAMCLLAVIATPIFHTLFGTKWDPSIMLFQIFLIRGIFVALSSLYGNFFLALAKSRLLVVNELLRDGTSILAIAITLPYIAVSTRSNIVYGIEIFLWGQLFASILTWGITLVYVSNMTGRKLVSYLTDIIPYALLTFVSLIPCLILSRTISVSPLCMCVIQASVFAIIYLSLNCLLKSRIQSEAIEYVFGKKSKKL